MLPKGIGNARTAASSKQKAPIMRSALWLTNQDQRGRKSRSARASHGAAVFTSNAKRSRGTDRCPMNRGSHGTRPSIIWKDR